MSTFIGIAASSGVSTINYTSINVYYHVQSSKLCQGLGTASVVYVQGSGSSINTIGRAYSASTTIFSDTGLYTVGTIVGSGCPIADFTVLSGYYSNGSDVIGTALALAIALGWEYKYRIITE